MVNQQKNDIQFAQLVDMSSPSAVFEEVKCNFTYHYSIADFMDIRNVFADFNNLMDGRYTGYKGCNTRYHDKMHTTDALLVISRLIDGYNIEYKKLPVNKVRIALISTILHDSGYIQTAEDTEGTGAKYTLSHIKRSISFMEKYFQEKKWSRKDFVSAKNMVKCTGLDVNISSIKFNDNYEYILSIMLGTADLIGQMSSRTYLERLLFLYHEFKEGNVSGYTSEFDLLKKTLDFYAGVKIRLEKDLDSVYKYALTHFRKRYHINKNLYLVAIQREIEYLRKILNKHPQLYWGKLRRTV